MKEFIPATRRQNDIAVPLQDDGTLLAHKVMQVVLPGSPRCGTQEWLQVHNHTSQLITVYAICGMSLVRSMGYQVS